jgi:pimeloyl-ACP methyl ester carboxylesterase
MREMEVGRSGRVLRVRDAGDPGGAVVMYFHGTPSSRLDLRFGEELAAGRGVRLVSFDRPGYGGSTPAPFGLTSIGADAHAVADALGVARFVALGLSGGGRGRWLLPRSRADGSTWSRRSVKLAVNGRRAAAIVPHDGR